MKYYCPDCLGHVDLEGQYGGQEMGCPHCQAVVQFRGFGVAIESSPSAHNHSLLEIGGPEQPLEAVASAVRQLGGYCTGEETVLRLVIQSKLMAASFNPDLIAATNRRVMILRRGIFSCQMWDALWIDVVDVRIAESFTGATLTVERVNGSGALLEKLPKMPSREFYRFCQSREEMMRLARHSAKLQMAAHGAAKVNVNIGPPPIPPSKF